MMNDWLDAQEQTVETFNKIFNLTQLRNLNPKLEVSLGVMHTGERREVFVNGKTLLMRLEADALQSKWLKEFQLDIDEDEDLEIPDDLNTVESSVLSFIKSEVKVSGLTKIQKALDISMRSLDRTISSLKSKELIEALPTGKGSMKTYIMKRLEAKSITDVSHTYKLSGADFKVYTFVKEYKLVENRETIAENTDLNLKTVTNSLMTLEDMGLIEKVQNGRSKMIRIVEK
jgi:DNA-binding MarR family transcriptional regulator